MTSTAPTRPARNRQVSSRIANDDNSVGLSAAAQNLLSAKPIIDLVKKIAKLTLFLPETVPLATEEDDIPRRIFELEGEDGTVTSTFNRRVDILFGEHVRDSDGRLKYVRRGNLGMDCVVKYLESIHWETAKIPLDLAQGKLARIADELDYLWEDRGSEYKIIVRPLAQTLWSLEATTANPSDAMAFWLAAAHALDSVFAQDPGKTHISAALAGHIRAAFNGRYHQFFSHSDIYFVAFCLDPRYPIGDYLRERVVPAPEAPTHIKFSHAFLRVKAFIKTLLKGLIDRHQKHDSGCNCHPIFKRKTSLEIVRECQAQLEACWQGEAPFHAPILNDDAMEWWENLEIGYSPRSGVLAMLAVRIFGILANSMPDECTNSNITWFNSPLRGNQKAENLLDMILVGQWHTYHAELLEKVKHKAADHSNSDSETDSDSDKESDSPTVVAESVPTNTVVSAPAVGEEPSHSEDEEADRIRRRYHRKKQAAKTKGKKQVFPSHTTFVIDPDINLRSAGLKELLSDEPSAPKTHAAVVIGVGASSSDNQDLWEGW
ncbi:hypothetical protein B0H13DRAFT_2289066 [Mycena leptocephala]|nr:hypothetical protein B0H13DRAFT_2289066 [Mycena leptocephala]